MTQHFTAKSSSSPLNFSKTAYALTDNDVRNGKTIGRDVLICTHTGTGASHCHVAFAQNGGLLYARFSLADKTGALKGVVTGGTGSFANANGTLTGQAVSRKAVEDHAALHEVGRDTLGTAAAGSGRFDVARV